MSEMGPQPFELDERGDSYNWPVEGTGQQGYRDDEYAAGLAPTPESQEGEN